MSKHRVAAIVVTYNRRNLLKLCIDALLNQNTDLEHIFIVNNASTDGTLEYLERNFATNKQITVLNSEENTGGAGGFQKGLETAFKRGFDWYWMMDDDVAAEVDCLTQLLRFSGVSGCIHPRKRFEDGEYFEWFGKLDPRSGRVIFKSEKRLWEGTDHLKVNYGCFEGMLVSDSIVEKIGFPSKDYFIHHDDRVYGYLASLHTDVLYLRDAKMRKLLKINNNEFSEIGYFYRIRNIFLIRRDLAKFGKLRDVNWAMYLIGDVLRSLMAGTLKKGGGLKPLPIAIRAILAGARFK